MGAFAHHNAGNGNAGGGMSKKKTGGPAFPTNGYFEGMTLRDYFAAHALPGAMVSLPPCTDDQAAKMTAAIAYKIADEMLKKAIES